MMKELKRPDLGTSIAQVAEALLPHSERAYRLWEAARGDIEQGRNPQSSEARLRSAEKLFAQERMFRQRLGVLEDLTALLDRQGRDGEAQAVRQRIKQEVEG